MLVIIYALINATDNTANGDSAIDTIRNSEINIQIENLTVQSSNESIIHGNVNVLDVGNPSRLIVPPAFRFDEIEGNSISGSHCSSYESKYLVDECDENNKISNNLEPIHYQNRFYDLHIDSRILEEINSNTNENVDNRSIKRASEMIKYLNAGKVDEIKYVSSVKRDIKITHSRKPTSNNSNEETIQDNKYGVIDKEIDNMNNTIKDIESDLPKQINDSLQSQANTNGCYNSEDSFNHTDKIHNKNCEQDKTSQEHLIPIYKNNEFELPVKERTSFDKQTQEKLNAPMSDDIDKFKLDPEVNMSEVPTLHHIQKISDKNEEVNATNSENILQEITSLHHKKEITEQVEEITNTENILLDVTGSNIKEENSSPKEESILSDVTNEPLKKDISKPNEEIYINSSESILSNVTSVHHKEQISEQVKEIILQDATSPQLNEETIKPVEEISSKSESILSDATGSNHKEETIPSVEKTNSQEVASALHKEDLREQVEGIFVNNAGNILLDVTNVNHEEETSEHNEKTESPDSLNEVKTNLTTSSLHDSDEEKDTEVLKLNIEETDLIASKVHTDLTGNLQESTPNNVNPEESSITESGFLLLKENNSSDDSLRTLKTETSKKESIVYSITSIKETRTEIINNEKIDENTNNIQGEVKQNGDFLSDTTPYFDKENANYEKTESHDVSYSENIEKIPVETSNAIAEEKIKDDLKLIEDQRNFMETCNIFKEILCECAPKRQKDEITNINFDKENLSRRLPLDITEEEKYEKLCETRKELEGALLYAKKAGLGAEYLIYVNSMLDFAGSLHKDYVRIQEREMIKQESPDSFDNDSNE